jgi:hypothetical protein
VGWVASPNPWPISSAITARLLVCPT